MQGGLRETDTILFCDDVDVLAKAFDVFSRTATHLQSACMDHRGQALSLNFELEHAGQEFSVNQSYLNSILQSITNGVIVVDLQMAVTHINRSASEQLGISPLDAICRPLTDIFMAPLETHEFPRAGGAREAILPGKGEGKGVYVSYSLTPLMDPFGKVIGSILVFSDTTPMKRLEEQVQRARRLSAMGEMAAGMAHEIRNPLGSLELFSSLLRRELEAGSYSANLADNILMAVKTLTSITSNLLYFARPCVPVLKPVSINAVIDETLVICQHLINQGDVSLIRKFTNSDQMADLDRDLMKQAFLNIFLNALQAMKSGGALLVSTCWHSSCVEIEITDTGLGIEPEYQDRIFDPFFSTRTRGTGLGLAIVHNIVMAHHGSIDVCSSKGKGTSFVISLPVRHLEDERRAIPRAE